MIPRFYISISNNKDVVNYDKDGSKSTFLDNIKSLKNANNDLNEFSKLFKELDSYDNLDDLIKKIPKLSNEVKNVAKSVADNTKSMSDFDAVCTKASSSTAKFAATLKSVGANIAIMLVINVAIKFIAAAWDHFNVTVEETQEEIDKVNSKLSELNSELDTLLEKEPSQRTDAEKERIKYLKERIDLEEELLKRMQQRQASEELGNKFTDYFDKDSQVSKLSKIDQYSSQYSLSNYIGEQSIGKTEALNIDILLEKYNELDKTTVDYATKRADLEDKLQDKFTDAYNTYLDAQDEIAHLDELIASGNLTQGDQKKAEDYKKNWETRAKNAQMYFNIIDNELNTTDTILSKVDEKFNFFTAEDLSKKFSSDEILLLLTLDLDENATEEEIREALEKAQEIVDDTPVELDIDGNVKIDTQTALTNLDKLSDGFDKIDSIMADIIDGENFDYGSLVDEDFITTFKDCGEAYTNFIETVSSSPKDINACQDSFNNLLSAWLQGQPALQGLSEDTLDLTTQYLKQKGVVNAEQIVHVAYAKQLIQTAIETGNVSDKTVEYIQKLYEESDGADYAANMMNLLKLQMIDVNSATFDFSQQIGQLQALALQALSTSSALASMFSGGILSDAHQWTDKNGVIHNTSTAVMQEMIGGLSQAEAEKVVYQKALAKFQKEMQANMEASLNNLTKDAPTTNYSGGDTTKSAKDNSGSGSGSSSDSYYDTYQEMLDDKQAVIDKIIAKDEELNAQYEEAIRTNNYDLARSLKDQIIANKSVLQQAYADSAESIRNTLNGKVLPVIFELAPELKGIDVGDWSEVMLKNISENLSDTNKTIFDSAVSAAQAMYEKVGSANGQGEWASAYREQYKAIDEAAKSYYESVFEQADKAIEKHEDAINSIDDLISAYDDAMDTIETLEEMQGETMDSYAQWYNSAKNKIIQYKEKESAIQKELIANETALGEARKALAEIDPNDPKMVETYEYLQDKIKDYSDAIEENKKALKDNKKEQLEYYADLHGQIVDRLRDIYETQRDEAEKALEERQEAELEALENEADAAQKASDAKIEALEKEREALEKNNEEREKSQDLNEKILELQKVKRDNSFTYIDDNGNEVKTYDLEKAKELEQEIQDLFEENAYEERLDAIDQQIDAEEEQSDKIQEEYDKRIEALKEAQEKEKEAFDAYWDRLLSDQKLNQEARLLEEKYGYEESLKALDGYYNQMQSDLESKNDALFATGQSLVKSLMNGMFADLPSYMDAFVEELKTRAEEIGSADIYTSGTSKSSNNLSGTDKVDVIKQMYANSLAWANATSLKDKDFYQSLNAELGDRLGAEYNEASGAWTINGKNIYDSLDKSTKDSIDATIENSDRLELLTNAAKSSSAIEKQLNTTTGTNTTKIAELIEKNDEVIDALEKNTEAQGNGNSTSNSTSNSNSNVAGSLGTTIKTSTVNGITTRREIDNATKDIVGEIVTDKNGNVLSSSGTLKVNNTSTGASSSSSSSSSNSSSSSSTSQKQKYYVYTFEDNGQAVTIESLKSRYDYALADAVIEGKLSKNAKFIGSSGYVYKHDGILSGLIGDTSLTDKQKLLRDIALGKIKIKNDEQFIIGRNGEGVFTAEQMNKLSDAITSSMSVPRIDFSGYRINPVQYSQSTASQQVVEKGDTFIIQNMTVHSNDVDTLLKSIRLRTK